MLSVFPTLLTFGIFAPFVLRIAVGIFFFLRGYDHIKGDRTAAAKEFEKWAGSFSKTFMVAVAAIELAIGLALIAGFLTQIAALLGAIFALKLLWFRKGYKRFAPDPAALYWMVFAICLSLLVLGAGAFAVDLPL